MTGRGATTTARGATTTGRAATHPARYTPTAQTTALASVVVRAMLPPTRRTGIKYFIANDLSKFVVAEKSDATSKLNAAVYLPPPLAPL
jgi:hypothetical protein